MERMSKTKINIEYEKMIENKTFSIDMLLGIWYLLDRDVSKYAYLKKKFSNAGKYVNGSNIDEFNKSIQKRNLVERFLKQEFGIYPNEIKGLLSELPPEKFIYRKYLDTVCTILKEIYDINEPLNLLLT